MEAGVNVPYGVTGLGITGSPMTVNLARAREFTPGFRIDLHHKDMGIAIDSLNGAAPDGAAPDGGALNGQT